MGSAHGRIHASGGAFGRSGCIVLSLMTTKAGFKCFIPASWAMVLSVLVTASTTVVAQDHAKPPSGEDLVKTQLLADVGAVEPGETFHLAVRYEIAPHWHIYWSNPGDSGMPPSISIEAPSGFEVGEILWPRPHVFRAEDLTYGYEKEVLLLVPVKAPVRIAGSSVSFEVALDWFVCRKVCLMGMREQTLTLPLTKVGRPVPPGSRIVRSWLGKMPIPMQKVRGATARIEGSNLVLSGPAGTSKPAWFYPDTTPGVAPQAAGPIKGTLQGGRYAFNIPLEIKPENALGKRLRVAGIVALGPDAGARAIRIDIPVPVPDETETTNPNQG